MPKIKVGGKEFDAVEIDVTASNEKWNEYTLEDGSKVKMKVVVTKVLRVEGAYDPVGNPMYLVQSSNVMNVDAPAALQQNSEKQSTSKVH